MYSSISWSEVLFVEVNLAGLADIVDLRLSEFKDPPLDQWCYRIV